MDYPFQHILERCCRAAPVPWYDDVMLGDCQAVPAPAAPETPAAKYGQHSQHSQFQQQQVRQQKALQQQTQEWQLEPDCKVWQKMRAEQEATAAQQQQLAVNPTLLRSSAQLLPGQPLPGQHQQDSQPVADKFVPNQLASEQVQQGQQLRGKPPLDQQLSDKYLEAQHIPGNPLDMQSLLNWLQPGQQPQGQQLLDLPLAEQPLPTQSCPAQQSSGEERMTQPRPRQTQLGQPNVQQVQPQQVLGTGAMSSALLPLAVPTASADTQKAIATIQRLITSTATRHRASDNPSSAYAARGSQSDGSGGANADVHNAVGNNVEVSTTEMWGAEARSAEVTPGAARVPHMVAEKAEGSSLEVKCAADQGNSLQDKDPGILALQQGQVPQPKALQPKTLPPKTLQIQPPEVGSKQLRTQPVYSQPVGTKPTSSAQSMSTQPISTQPMSTQPVRTESVTTQLVQSPPHCNVGPEDGEVRNSSLLQLEETRAVDSAKLEAQEKQKQRPPEVGVHRTTECPSGSKVTHPLGKGRDSRVPNTVRKSGKAQQRQRKGWKENGVANSIRRFAATALAADLYVEGHTGAKERDFMVTKSSPVRKASKPESERKLKSEPGAHRLLRGKLKSSSILPTKRKLRSTESTFETNVGQTPAKATRVHGRSVRNIKVGDNNDRCTVANRVDAERQKGVQLLEKHRRQATNPVLADAHGSGSGALGDSVDLPQQPQSQGGIPAPDVRGRGQLLGTEQHSGLRQRPQSGPWYRPPTVPRVWHADQILLQKILH